MTPREARWRDALVASILPAPGRGLPSVGEVDLREFWPRFEASAPAHLRLGLRAATILVGGLPFVLGYSRSLARLDEAERDAVLARAHRLPVFSELVDVAKIVACLAYFTDPAVQATARRRS